MLYLFYGPDSFTRREALRALKSELDEDGMLDTSTVAFDASQASSQEVIAACNTPPFLGPRRLVVVEGIFQQTEGGPKGRRSKRRDVVPNDDSGPWQALVDYVPSMPESTVLVLVDSTAPSGAAAESLKKLGTATAFPALEQGALIQWVRRRAQAIGLKMAEGVPRLLVQLAGGQSIKGNQYVDTWSLAAELEKLRAFADGEPARESDVRALVSNAREEKGYLLADAVVEGRAAAAFRLLHELRTQEAVDQVLLATIAGRYRRIGVARDMLDSNASARSIGERLGLKPGFATDRCVEQAQRYSAGGVRAAFARIVQADADHKLGVYDEELSLELLINDLSSAPAASRAA